MRDFARALVATVLLGLAVHVPAIIVAQSQTVRQLEGEGKVGELVAWGLRESPTALLVLVILFFYRRDFMREVNKEQHSAEQLLKLVQDSTAANTEVIATMREANVVTHGLKRAIENRFDLHERANNDRL